MVAGVPLAVFPLMARRLPASVELFLRTGGKQPAPRVSNMFDHVASVRLSHTGLRVVLNWIRDSGLTDHTNGSPPSILAVRLEKTATLELNAVTSHRGRQLRRIAPADC